MIRATILVILPFIAPSFVWAQAIKLNGSISIENYQIKNVADPIDAKDLITKDYLDNKISDLDFRINEIENSIDSDGDGIPNVIDTCPNTPNSDPVNEKGCSISQLNICWEKVSEITDYYSRIVEANNGKYYCNASNGNDDPIANNFYESMDLINWTPKDIQVPGKTHIAFGKDSYGRLFLSTAHNGLYKSLDDGETWSYANVGNGYGNGALDFECDSQNNLYVGIGGAARGLYISYDNGNTWINKVAGKDFVDIQTVINSQYTYAVNTNNELWFSSNSGENWNQVLSQPFSGKSIMIKSISENIYVFCNDGEIYESTNEMLDWSLYGKIVLDSSATNYNNNFVSYGSTWFVGYENNGLWMSVDDGVNWEKVEECISGSFKSLYKSNSTIIVTTSNGIYKYNFEQ